ncbi:MAG TPA: GNAT family N-acetyltransferase [Hyphomicrobiaceae bacterium]|nr:GNAT family N-acetyltransferase [Hyphomicrobiaceae bacterium]
MSEVLLEYGFSERDRKRIVDLLRAYEVGAGVSLCFQDFDAEVASLPGNYAPPRGTMLLARQAGGDDFLGCVALRPVPDRPDLCEMKRLYVRPGQRGSGLGRTLALAVMAEACRLGYRRICLDTLPGMTAAQALYRALGFRHTGVTTTKPHLLLFERALGEVP